MLPVSQVTVAKLTLSQLISKYSLEECTNPVSPNKKENDISVSFALCSPPSILQTVAMSGEDWGDTVLAETPTVEVKLFGKWSPDEVHVNDISLAVSLLYSKEVCQ